LFLHFHSTLINLFEFNISFYILSIVDNRRELPEDSVQKDEEPLTYYDSTQVSIFWITSLYTLITSVRLKLSPIEIRIIKWWFLIHYIIHKYLIFILHKQKEVDTQEWPPLFVIFTFWFLSMPSILSVIDSLSHKGLFKDPAIIVGCDYTVFCI
jgi:hypothetical protein